MTFLAETPIWPAGVRHFEANAILTGGPDCPDNLPLQDLANRTRYLKERVEAAQGDIDSHEGATDPHPQYMTPAKGDQRYLGQAGGTLTGPLWLLSNGFKQLNASGDGDFEIVHRGNGDVSIYVNNGSNRLARFTQTGRMILGEAVDNTRDVLQVAGSVCAASPADGADNNQLPPTAWVNRRISAAVASLVNSSPAALDTLNELATALGNDPNFATTIMNLLAGKAPRATTLAGYGITDAVPISAFTGANKSLEENGYQVLPGGLILQWGRVSVPASTRTIVALPMTFPLAHHNSQATGTTSNGVEPEVAVISRSLNSITLITDYAQTVDWFAIGK